MKKPLAQSMKKLPVHEQAKASLYDSDFFQWTQTAAERLRQGDFAHADIKHVAEEIEDMGKRDFREVRSSLVVLLMHHLKWAAQPGKRTESWKATILEQRRELELLFEDSPSLRRKAEETMPKIVQRACSEAQTETGLGPEAFGGVVILQAHVSLDQLLRPEFPDDTDDLLRRV